MTRDPRLDDDELIAHADVLGRMGCAEFEVGYLHDDVPSELAGWYAHVKYIGTRVTEDNHPGPVEAVRALARKLLERGGCKCGRTVTLDEPPPAAAAVACWWQLHLTVDGTRWLSGCDAPTMDVDGRPGELAALRAAFAQRQAVTAAGGNRAARRAAQKRNRRRG